MEKAILFVQTEIFILETLKTTISLEKALIFIMKVQIMKEIFLMEGSTDLVKNSKQMEIIIKEAI